jgi:GT2 family glycosyltransferase
MPYISVLIPVYNGGQYVNQCLEALEASSYQEFEIIVVDDASTDESAAISRKKGVTVLQLPKRGGPAAARNRGAEIARGEILLFLDSDVLVKCDTIERVAATFLSDPDIAAVFGSYDDAPAERNFCSQYKNLYHHFVHQHANPEASTFWAGCGAIRREIFQQIGGFDQLKYPESSIEDIELGYRLRGLGYRIRLDKGLQVKHLKRWTLGSLLRTDIFRRAVPWSKLILESEQKVNDLNLRTSDRVSAGSVGLSIGMLLLSLFKFQVVYGVLPLLAIVFLLNYPLYAFLMTRTKINIPKRGGVRFLLFAFPLHLFYFLYSSFTFAVLWFRYTVLRRPKYVRKTG